MLSLFLFYLVNLNEVRGQFSIAGLTKMEMSGSLPGPGMKGDFAPQAGRLLKHHI